MARIAAAGARRWSTRREPKRKRAPAKPARKPAAPSARGASGGGGGKRAAPGRAAAASDGGGKRASLAVAGAKAAAPAASAPRWRGADGELGDLLGSSDDDDAPGAGAGLDKAAADAAARRRAASALHVVDPAAPAPSLPAPARLATRAREGDRSVTDEQRFDAPTPPPLELDLGAAPRELAAAPPRRAASRGRPAEALKVAVWVALGRDRAAALKDTGHRLALKDARLYARHVLARDAVSAADLGLLAPRTKLWQKRWEAKKVAGRKQAPRTDEERKMKQRRDNADDLSDGVHSWAAGGVLGVARCRGGGSGGARAGPRGPRARGLRERGPGGARGRRALLGGLRRRFEQEPAPGAAARRGGDRPDAAAPLALALAFALGGGGDADALRREADRRAAAPRRPAQQRGKRTAAAWALRATPADVDAADVATHWGEDAALLNEFYDDQTRDDQKKASLLRKTQSRAARGAVAEARVRGVAHSGGVPRAKYFWGLHAYWLSPGAPRSSSAPAVWNSNARPM
ncbi:hypothetical protein JL720_12093 [Aureococcus anophagefferens]|nr:hypothetical protein JL720_12093 [Aureococcus anophagefferens]